MNPLVLSLALAFGLSLLLTRAARSLALRYGAIDLPDGERKLHAAPVPLWGGVAVYLAFMLTMLAAWAWFAPAAESLPQVAPVLLLSASLIFLLGFVDDAFDVRARLKLLFQVLAVLPVALVGHWCDQIVVFGQAFELGSLGVPITVLWLVGCVNAMNLLDGMDGNVSVVSVLAAGAIGAIAWRHGHDHVTLASCILAGAVLGFMVYNLPIPSASIYLGDSGSTLIGLVLGTLCLEGAIIPSGQLHIAVPLVTMTIPLLDTTLAVVRRKLTGRRFDAADRGHIHHRLLEGGLNPWLALAMISGLCAFSGGAAFASTALDSEPLAWLASLTLIVTLSGTRYFGHHEFRLVRATSARWSLLLGGWLRQATTSHNAATAERLQGASFDEAWQVLTGEVQRWQGRRLELKVREEHRVHSACVWSADAEPLPPAERFPWRLAMVFGPRYGPRCELVVTGLDAATAEPWYLNHLASVLRTFGRHWSVHLEQLPHPTLRLFDPRRTTTAGDDVRDAA